tara:strand:- start:476 stop:685 length:210 start_codon:yes stop_codon:yes gene_type:complete
MQSRVGSFVESIANVMVGYLIAVLAQVLIFPHFGVHVTTRDHFIIAAVFTVVSIVRSYCLRRLFNRVKL